MSGFLILTWKKIHEASLKLASEIAREGLEIDLIVGILRGGYIIARILGDMLGTENIGVVEVKFYKGIEERAERPIITQPLTADVKGKNVLVVDDVVDSGRTLEIVTEQVRLRGARSVRTAVLFYKPKSIIRPDFFAQETSEWVVFPWELCEFIRELRVRDQISDPESLIAKLRSIGFPEEETSLQELVRTCRI
ncbi:MAG: phosphoribosyltransferase [Desulfurococcaceae archaeon]|jgi:hypoxanthine phosphoribosyltransferase|nr:phosphoribosyltransferase [Desulfurococcaceae archaeon]